MMVETAHKLSTVLQSLLLEAGCIRYSEQSLRRDCKRCCEDIAQDEVAHGGDPTKPFFSFTIIEGIAVFSIFGDPFEIYIVRCDEEKLIRKFQSDFAMKDIDPCKEYLANFCGKTAPDVVAPRSVAQLWMEST